MKSPERQTTNPDGDLEEIIELRISRLPSGVRKYIRHLKSEGRYQEAERIRTEQYERKKSRVRQDVAQELLNATSEQILLEEDPKKRDLYSIKALWLMEATGMIDAEERKKGVSEIYLNPDVDEDYIESRWPEIEQELRPLMPLAK